MADFNAADGSWSAMDTVYDWESNDCVSSAREPFPDYGDYSAIPQFASATIDVYDWDGTSVGPEEAELCFVVDFRTDYIVWQKDAFRNCIYDAWNPAR